MAEVKHTPGEWRLDTVPLGAAFGAAAGRAYGVSAVTTLGLRTPVVVWRGIAKPASDEGQANARLIAAAPDLFEAGTELQAARRAHKLNPSAESLSRVRAASHAFDAALSKATTQQEGR